MNLADLQAAEQTVKQYTADFRSIKKLEDALAFAVRVVAEVDELSAKKAALVEDLAALNDVLATTRTDLTRVVGERDSAQASLDSIRETIRSFAR